MLTNACSSRGRKKNSSRPLDLAGYVALAAVHDINNLLAAIILNLGALQEHCLAGAETKAVLQEIEATILVAGTVARQALALPREEMPEGSPVDMRSLVADSAKMFRPLVGDRIVVKTEVCDAPLSVKADAQLLKAAVMNLIINARDAMPDGGNLVLGLAPAIAGNSGSFARLSVSDTGCGMEPITVKRIFKPFFSTKPSGTGLGLPLVQQVIAEHGGAIRCESAPNAGTSFIIELPCAEEPPHAPKT